MRSVEWERISPPSRCKEAKKGEITCDAMSKHCICNSAKMDARDAARFVLPGGSGRFPSQDLAFAQTIDCLRANNRGRKGKDAAGLGMP